MKLVSFSVATVVGEIVRLGTLLEDSRIVDLNLAYVSYLTENGTTGRPYEVATGIMPPDMVEFFKGGKLSQEATGKIRMIILNLSTIPFSNSHSGPIQTIRHGLEGIYL